LRLGNSGVAVGPDGVTTTFTLRVPAKPFKLPKWTDMV
jgi:hypothetical protein